MKIKTISSAIIVFLLTLTISLNAQVSEINNIREIYNSYNLLIEKQGTESNMELPLKIVTSYTITERAIGPVEYKITFYYDRNETIQTEPYNVSYSNTLRKIVFSKTSSGTVYKEFLYDSNNKLIFSYIKTSGIWTECSEQRFYYKEGKLIRVIFTKDPDESNTCNAGTRDNKALTSEDIKAGKEVMENATKFEKIFSQFNGF